MRGRTRRPAGARPIMPTARLLPVSVRLTRATLLRSTALQAAVALTTVLSARAQPAPNARPQGGQVVAGAATISRSPTNTVVDQSSGRAAIDWRGFDVGRNQSVTFQQPTASSVTLNRVTGPDPSAIAGRISANGQIILTNPNGVTFFRGAQVNAQSVVVSAPGITNQNFMAGRMVFDQPASPNARIDNAGTITVKQAGLAALVAPSVANSGTINARLGTVVLAGAATHTLDMYGDGLVAIDVTKQVRQAPVGSGGKTVTALVTNSGTIAADGGSIQISAAAADGVVQTLVQAGGNIRADTVAGKTGRIEIAGTGGSIVIAGRVAADGQAGPGGSIVLNGTAATTLTDTAHVTATGRTGGGTIAVGTTLARARSTGAAPANTSARTTIAAGARLAANATARGDGGRVTVLSKLGTTVDGSVEAKGGSSSGNGGTIELSGETGFRLTGRADATAPHGSSGTILLDPRDLFITNNPPPNTANQLPANADPNIAANAGGTTADAYVTPAQLQSLSGTLHVLTTHDLTVSSPLNYTQNGVILEAGHNLTVTNGGSVTAGGNLYLIAASTSIHGYDPTGTLSIAGAVRGVSVALSGGTGGIRLSANVSAPVVLQINTTGALTQTAGVVTTPQLYGSAGSVSLSSFNAVNGVGNGQNAAFQTTSGGFLLVNQAGQSLTVGNPVGGGGLFVPTGQAITLATDRIAFDAPAGGKAVTAPGGTLTIQAVQSGRSILVSDTDSTEGTSLVIAPSESSRLAIDTLQLGTRPGSSSSITLGQNGETIDFTAAGINGLSIGVANPITQGGPLIVANLAVSSGTSTDLSNTGNRIGMIRGLTATGPTTITTAGNLTLSGSIAVDTATITAGGSITQSAASVLNVTGSVSLVAGDTAVSGYNPAAAVTLAGRATVSDTLSLSSGTGGVALTGPVQTTDLIVSTGGPLSQGTNAISAVGSLTGNASAVNLASASNTIASIGNFSVSGATGDFVLVDNRALLVFNGGITTQSGRTINLATDSLTVNGGLLSAPGGNVVIQPYTARTPILLTGFAKFPGTLALGADDLANISTSQLTLGGLNTGTGQRNSGTITLGLSGEAIDLTARGFGTLSLNTTGSVVQGGALSVRALTANVGNLTLNTAGNLIGTVAGVSATGNVSLHTNGNLSVGQVFAGGNIALSSSGNGGMTISGAVQGQAVDLNSLSSSIASPTPYDPGIIEPTGGSITANVLTGAAGQAQFGNVNSVAQLGNFVTYSGLRLNDTGTSLTVTGAVSASTGAISLSTASLTQTAASSISAPELDGNASASTTLTSRNNAIAAIGSFLQSAGDFSLASSARILTLGQRGGTVSAPTGSLTFIADRLAVAGSSTAGRMISAPNGAVTVAPYTAGRPIQLIGNSAADVNTLSISTGLTGQITTGTLRLGTAGTTSAITIGNPGDLIDLRGSMPTLLFQTSGTVTEAASAGLIVASLGGTAGSINMAGTGNQIATVQNLAATAGPLTLRSGTSLLANTVSATGILDIASTNGLSTAGTLSGSNVTLTAGTNFQQTAGAIAADVNNGIVKITAGGTLGIGSTGPGGITGSSINLTGAGGITQSGGIVTTGALTLSAPGQAITQAGGVMFANTLSTNSASLALPGANQVNRAAIAATGTVTLNDTSPLTLTALSATDATIATTGDLILSGTVGASNRLTLNAAGAITQPGGTVNANRLSASGTSVTLGQSGNAIATLSTLTTPGAATIRNSGDLTITGPVTANTLTVDTSGYIVLAGDMTVGTLAGSADFLAYVVGKAYRISSVGRFATVSGLALNSAIPLTVTGPLTDASSGISLYAPAITLAGSVTAPSLALVSPGDVTQTAGALAVGTLQGSADRLDIGNQAPATLTTLGAFTAATSLSVTDAAGLVVTGPLSAPSLSVSAVGTLTLAGGTIQTTGQVTTPGQASAAIGAPGADFTVSPDGNGRADFIQTGTTVVTSLSGGSNDLRVDLPAAGGTATLSDLRAASSNLILSLGSGSAAGALDAGQLVLLGAGGQATLNGQVAGLGGEAAAQTAQLRPASDARYTLNGCAIGVGCTTTPGTPPSTTPTQPDQPPPGTPITQPTLPSTPTLPDQPPPDLPTTPVTQPTNPSTPTSPNQPPADPPNSPVVQPTTPATTQPTTPLVDTPLPASPTGLTSPGLSVASIAPADVPSVFNPPVVQPTTPATPQPTIAVVDTPLLASRPTNGITTLGLPIATIDPADVPSVFNPIAAIASVLRPDILTLGILDLTVTRDRDDPSLLLPNISDRDY